ncbi:MAG: thioredoxin-like domain-containing protein [Ignavibacteriaceae bacterium]
MYKILLLAFAVTLINCGQKNKDRTTMDFNNYKGNAPTFPYELEWLNIEGKLQISDLKGKIIILDFWTYCCINCMHIIPDLKKLEAKYPNELVVIGVHSAKFRNEKDTENIRRAILRYGIEHPVVNDHKFQIWTKYGANAWPTVILINPLGDIAGYISGEGIFEPFDKAIAKLITEFDDVIDRTPFKPELEKNTRQKAVLNFPGKVLADEKTKRLFITDSNNDRIIISDLDGNIQDVIGSGKEGTEDGSFEQACFNKPQGLSLDGNILYIADTENHLIRKADLSNRTLETIAGTGEQATYRAPLDKGSNTALNSPWDLTLVNGVLYIAMAGPHQIWSMTLSNGKIEVFAGSGSENIHDADLLSSSLAQPSGITHDGENLYFADSEVSAVRLAELKKTGKVKTLIGHGLFEFGDKDGGFYNALLQHPLGLVYNDGLIYLADTYNHKIKVLDLAKKEILTLAGNGEGGYADGINTEARFYEPGGVTIAAGKLYVADTNNDQIRVIDIKTKSTSTLLLKNLEKLKSLTAVEDYKSSQIFKKIPDVNLATLKNVRVNINLPEGYKINPDGNNFIRLYSEKNGIDQTIPVASTDITCPLKGIAAENLFCEIVIYYCSESNNALCKFENRIYKFTDNKNGNKDVYQLDVVLKK